MQFLSAVHRKLGAASEANFVNINVNATTGGTFVTCTYQSAFAQGRAVETFVWKKSLSGDLKLYSYNIQSKELVLH